MNSANDSPLVLRDVRKSYQQGKHAVQALRGVNLTIQAGEFVAIMGASGSGKSTLLHAMAGLTDVDSGSVLVAGNDLSKLSDKQLTAFRRAEIGLVFQSFNLLPTLTAEANVLLPAIDVAQGASRARDLIARLGLESRKHHKPDSLSGGEQQRVAIARSLINQPSLVLADEPTGSLDSVTGQSICKLLKELCSEGRSSIVVVTHEPHVARWADRVIVLRDGLIIASLSNLQEMSPEQLAVRYHEVLSSREEVLS